MRVHYVLSPQVEGYYTASLLVRGFKAVTIPATVPVLAFPKLIQEYLKHNGCLLISDDLNSVEIADQFELKASQFGVTLLRFRGLLVERTRRPVPRRNRRTCSTLTTAILTRDAAQIVEVCPVRLPLHRRRRRSDIDRFRDIARRYR